MIEKKIQFLWEIIGEWMLDIKITSFIQNL